MQLRTEFTLCRIYVISGSFRAFDRRPMEPAAEEAQRGHSGTEAPPVEGCPVELQESRGSSSGEATTSLQQPLWDWEQLIGLDGSSQSH